jgi:uncharacterized protein (DUF427 family)
MSLTRGDGPLTQEPADANYTIDGPAHRIFFEPFTRRVRAELAGETVIDTRDARLLHETGIRPRLYVPIADVRAEALEPSELTSFCPFKGDATYRSLRVGDRVAGDALWLYEHPIAGAAWLEHYAGVYEDRLDRWLDEDDDVVGYLPDPYHRVDIRHSSRTVRVTGPGETLLAETSAPLLVSETGNPDRFYVPRADVVARLERSERASASPYMGRSTYWSTSEAPEIAWSYETPLDEAARLAGYVCFEGEGVEVRAA